EVVVQLQRALQVRQVLGGGDLRVHPSQVGHQTCQVRLVLGDDQVGHVGEGGAVLRQRHQVVAPVAKDVRQRGGLGDVVGQRVRVGGQHPGHLRPRGDEVVELLLHRQDL